MFDYLFSYTNLMFTKYSKLTHWQWEKNANMYYLIIYICMQMSYVENTYLCHTTPIAPIDAHSGIM